MKSATAIFFHYEKKILATWELTSKMTPIEGESVLLDGMLWPIHDTIWVSGSQMILLLSDPYPLPEGINQIMFPTGETTEESPASSEAASEAAESPPPSSSSRDDDNKMGWGTPMGAYSDFGRD